jgi:hypothetical protein
MMREMGGRVDDFSVFLFPEKMKKKKKKKKRRVSSPSFLNSSFGPSFTREIINNHNHKTKALTKTFSHSSPNLSKTTTVQRHETVRRPRDIEIRGRDGNQKSVPKSGD